MYEHRRAVRDASDLICLAVDFGRPRASKQWISEWGQNTKHPTSKAKAKKCVLWPFSSQAETKAEYFVVFRSCTEPLLSTNGTVSSRLTTVLFHRENMTTSGLTVVAAIQQAIATALRGQRGIANHLFEEGETEGGARQKKIDYAMRQTEREREGDGERTNERGQFPK